MYCKNCGKELPKDSKFCPFCGTAQNNSSLSDSSSRQRKNTALIILKEVCIVALMVGIAFLAQFIVYRSVSNYPKVSDANMQAFNEAFIQRSIFEYDDWEQWEELKYLDYPSFKYDNEISFAQLFEINAARKQLSIQHGEKTAKVVFWIVLCVLPTITYSIRLGKWLKGGSDKSDNN